MARRADAVVLTLVQPRDWADDGDANFDAVSRLLRGSAAAGVPEVVVLPELVGSAMPRDGYLARVTELAVRRGAWVVGGSHHWDSTAGVRNAGVVVDPDGAACAP